MNWRPADAFDLVEPQREGLRIIARHLARRRRDPFGLGLARLAVYVTDIEDDTAPMATVPAPP